MADQLEHSLEQLAAAGRAASRRRTQQTTAAAVVDERVRSLEAEVMELKTRVNGLIFVLLGAVATQVVLRIFG